MSKDSLESKTKEELLALAKNLEIRISRSLLKREVIALLKRAMVQGRTKTPKAVSTKPKKSTKKSASQKPAKGKTIKKAKLRSPQKGLSRKKKPVLPVGHIDDVAQEAKFIVGRQKIQDEARGEYTQELPVNYGNNKLVLMVRDPYWVYSYWEIQQDKISAGLKALAKPHDEIRWVLRVFTTQVGSKTPASPPADIEVQADARSWYLHLNSAGATYYAEIGLMDRQGKFHRLATSNTITLPPDRPSDVVDEQWMSRDEEFQKLYTFASGDQLGGGSEVIQKGQGFPFGESSWGPSRGILFGHPSGQKEVK